MAVPILILLGPENQLYIALVVPYYHIYLSHFAFMNVCMLVFMQGVDENFVVLSQSEASDQEDAMVTIEMPDQNENWGGEYDHCQPITTQMDTSSGIDYRVS